MTFRISPIAGALFVSSVLMGGAKAQTAAPGSVDKSWIQAYQTKQMEFVLPSSLYAAATPGRQSLWITNLMKQYLTYEPQDSHPRAMGDCDPQKLYNSIRKASDIAVKTRNFDRYKNQCADELNKRPLNMAEQFIKMSTMHYSIDENPFFHRVVFHLPDGQRLKAVLALKDLRARPWVIVRMGIAGNIEEAFAERFFLYQLFERGLSNVLMVENMTGADYIHFNRRASFGGLDEAYQNIWLAQLLRSPSTPLSKTIQSLHLMGYSLGGQGVLTNAYMARYQANPRMFTSFTAFCPVVNLTETTDYLFKHSWIRFPLEIWARDRFKEVKEWWPAMFKKPMGLPVRLVKAVADGYKKPKANYLGVREPWFIQRQTDFYSLHNLSKWDASLRDPVLIFTTDQDFIVPPNLNTDQMALANPIRVAQSQHCSFPVVWDDRVLSAILNGHVNGTAQFQTAEKTLMIDLPADIAWDVSEVNFTEGRNIIDVVMATDKAKRTVQMNLSDLDFSFRSMRLSEHEKWMIRRWLSSNLGWRPADSANLKTILFWPIAK